MHGFSEREMLEFDFEWLQHVIHSVVFLQYETRNLTDGTQNVTDGTLSFCPFIIP